ncbi:MULTISPECIES: hypothetical protein [Halomonadaceae]|uniref:hypothetical protein n=1 Tax=Halomonadaceae TaxID=28256 RepID=UPI001C62BA3F|nr:MULTISPECIES: hypothetical protein [Halomonas]MCG7591828.1 hypothetical protein [Halomonas sp. McD50-5]MCG7617831.1 hypothetical protein [Halomonas sp. McD50-4]
MSAEQTQERHLNPVVVNVFEPPESDGESAGENATHVCQEQCWADILYLPGTHTFWLLTEEVSDILLEAAEQLKAWTQEEDAFERLRLLNDEAGLMECLLPTRAENFLDESERARYQSCFGQLIDITADDEATLEEQIAHQRSFLESLWQLTTPALLNQLARHLTNAEAVRLESELRDLYQAGLQRAQEAGYSVEGERYYGPWEAEIAEALETYRTCRAAAQREYHFNPGSEGEATPFSLQEVLAEYQTFIRLCESMPPDEAAQACRFVGYVQQLSEHQESKYTDYLNSILTLASLGIATPELALSFTEDGAPPLEDGVSAFDTYCSTLKQSVELHRAVEEKLSEWESGTAGQAKLPIFLFEQERQLYESIQEELGDLFQQADAAIKKMEPSRVLIWHTDIEDDRHAMGYQKRQIELLVRRDFPLREFSSPQADQSLSHLSLYQLMPAMTPIERQRLDAAMSADGVLPAQLWESLETALSQWLRGRGCEPIEHRGEWHDDPLGFFQPERFFAYLEEQGHDITSLNGDSKERWGAALQKVLFTGPGREQLRLFDASAQAQMMRLVGMARFDLNEPRSDDERDTPWEVVAQQPTLTFFDADLEMSSGGSNGLSTTRRDELAIKRPSNGHWQLDESDPNKTSASVAYRWEAKGTFSLARGELPLGRLVLPREEQAQQVVATLNEVNEQRELGRYVVVVDAVAKGFAGASLALATETGFSLGEDGLSITGIDWTKREAEGATIEAFAGAKLGVETRCSMSWEPPANLERLLPGRAALSDMSMANPNQSLTGWRSLGTATLALELAAGLGGRLGFALGMQNGKFVLRMAARVVIGKGAGGGLSVELDVDSLDLWLAMLHRAMVDNNYVKPEWIDEEAYESMSWLGYLATTTLLNVGLLAARGQAGIERLYNAMTGGQNAGPIAYVIVNDPRQDKMRDWVQQLTPEGLGALLYLLVSEPRAFEVEEPGRGRSGGRIQSFSSQEALDFQQIAIANCLGWIVEGVTMSVYGPLCRFSREDPTPSQYLFTKAVVRMTADGQPPHNYPDTAYHNHKLALDRFMDQVSGTGNEDARLAKSDYRRYVAGLGAEICAN